jgi:hypothetical protein
VVSHGLSRLAGPALPGLTPTTEIANRRMARALWARGLGVSVRRIHLPRVNLTKENSVTEEHKDHLLPKC